MTTLEKITAAGTTGNLLPDTVENMRSFLGANLPDWAVASIDELVASEAWSELNDRFYVYLAFGTGGMLSAPLFTSSLTAVFGTQLTPPTDANGEPIPLEEGTAISYERFLGVGQGDIGSALNLVACQPTFRPCHHADTEAV